MKEVLLTAAVALSISTTVALADTVQQCPDGDVMCADIVVEAIRPYAREDAQRGDPVPQSGRFRLTETKIISNDDGTTQELSIYIRTEN
jgi:opacity protein-like surface antigen